MNLSLVSIFGAGVLTFASPCVLPIVPVYFAMLAGTGTGDAPASPGRPRLLATTMAFAAGLSSVFVLLGMGASAAGHALAAHRGMLLVAGAAGVILFGLKLLGAIRIPLLDREFRPALDRARVPAGSLVAAWLLGAAFAIGWTPCVGPVLGAVLTYTASRTSHPATGALYLGMYAAGITLPLIVASAFATRMLPWFRRMQRHLHKLEMATGVALIAFGVLLGTDRLGMLSASAEQAAAAPTPALASTPRAMAASCDTPNPGAVACDVAAATNQATTHQATALPDGPAVVEFVSRTCAVCQRMAPVVTSVAHSCRRTTLARIDVSEPEGGALAREMGVVGVPTFVTLDPHGQERERLIGEQTQQRLLHAFESIAGERCETTPPNTGSSS